MAKKKRYMIPVHQLRSSDFKTDNKKGKRYFLIAVIVAIILFIL